MSEEKNIDESPEDGKTGSPEEVNSPISQEQTIEQAETINPTSDITTSEIKDMEVHHHPHVEKKNFKEYFLEFLMIFLAVTLGFFAENIREKISDERQVRQYIESMLRDL